MRSHFSALQRFSKKFRKARVRNLVLGLLVLFRVAAGIGQDTRFAYQALQEGRVHEAATMLRAALEKNPSDGYAHELLCRVFYVQDAAEDAVRECELAAAAPGASGEQASMHQLWLGRAYGLKARHAGPIGGFKLAKKVQASFSRAVELDPANVAAYNDLGEYDVNAPFIVGGGNDKALALAARMMPRFPGQAHLLLARAAQQRKELNLAESEFKQEVAILKTAEAWINLADFYQSHARPDDTVAAIRSALAADRAHGPATVDAASILTAAHREPELAEKCLRDYLNSRAKSDAAPAFKVHLQLSRLLAARGDASGASQEVAAASELAPDFARKARATQGL